MIDHLFRNGGAENGYRCVKCDEPEGKHPDPAVAQKALLDARDKALREEYRRNMARWSIQEAYLRATDKRYRPRGKRSRAESKRLLSVWQNARRREERARERKRLRYRSIHDGYASVS